MAPEQVNGDAADHRVDLWALGVVLYEMLAGAPPFPGENDGIIINKILRHDPVPLRHLRSDVPPQVEHVIRRGLSKQPDHRYVSAADFARDLQACHANATGAQAVAAPIVRNIRRNAALVAVLAVVVVLAIPGGWWLKRSADQRRLDALIADVIAFDAKDERSAALATLEQAERLIPDDARVAALRDRVTQYRSARRGALGKGLR
jgi:hypothetical protein